MNGLNILEALVVFYWYLLDIRAFQDYQYWLQAGMRAKYAFKKVFNKI